MICRQTTLQSLVRVCRVLDQLMILFHECILNYLHCQLLKKYRILIYETFQFLLLYSPLLLCKKRKNTVSIGPFKIKAL